jgi:hypothetical protein
LNDDTDDTDNTDDTDENKDSDDSEDWVTVEHEFWGPDHTCEETCAYYEDTVIDLCAMYVNAH